MMKRVFLMITVCVPLLIGAQVAISVQLPAAGMIQKEQLWNLTLINNGSDIPDVSLVLELQDASTGQPVLSAGTRSFLFSKGVKMINMGMVQPIQYNYVAAELSANYIPLGSYVACYRLVRNSPKPEPLADECVRMNIDPLSPPLLNTPSDKAVLPTPYPLFTWLPPTPSEMFSNLNYDIVIAEVLPGQLAADALLNNTPIYTKSNIRSPYDNYPSGFSALQAGKQYAWQVTAKNGLNYSAQTEIWTFSLQSPDSAKNAIVSTAYISLGDHTDHAGVHMISKRQILVKYYSFYKEHKAAFRVLSPDGKMIQDFSRQLVYGNNFLVFELNKSLREEKTYTLEMTDPKQQKHSIQFTIRTTTSSN